MSPRIFVGTMKSIENEFEECIKAVERQKGVEVTHRIIEDLGEYDAHVVLYGEWEKVKREYDAFIKVDSDMILKSDTTLLECVNDLLESKASGFTSIQCPLYDHLIEDMIYGLNCYSPEVIFPVPKDRVFCDRTTVNNITRVIRSRKDTKYDLFPAGSHCSNPKNMQAFMWGYHRGSKNNFTAKHQLDQSIEKRPTLSKKMAALGFNAGQMLKKEMSYNDAEFAEIFSSFVRNET